MSKSDIAVHCGEYCEVRTDRACYFGRLLRIAGELFELECHDRHGSSVAVFTAKEIVSIASLPIPRY